MRKFLLIISFVLLGVISFAQINVELKKELDSILFKDQIYREFVDTETSESRKDSIAKLTHHSKEELLNNVWGIINTVDKENLEKVEKIIAQYDYPGKTMVGEPTNTAVFYVIQHSDKIKEYYPLIEKAAKKKELPMHFAAMMLDRKLLSEGKPQIYGTQLYGRQITNKETGEKEFFMYVQPIKNPIKVNKRRKKAGFETTVEENALKFNVVYKPYTFEELNKIQ